MKRNFIILFLMWGVSICVAQTSESPPDFEYYHHRNEVRRGDSEEFLVGKYGKPEHQFIKPRRDFVGVYYEGIELTYPSRNPEFKNIPIKEMFWHLKSDLNLTCWLHYKDGQWIVISYAFWPPGAVF
ncbi:hypothetical protein YV76_004630 [Salmonella enterica subsp. enterica]|nr:hypothetical protein [Salmonella enterica subsp. enterica]